MEFKLSRHAREEMERRGISQSMLESVLENPQQVIDEVRGKKIYQSQVDIGGGKIYLLRAVVFEEADPPLVITVYRTSKIAKYWRTA